MTVDSGSSALLELLQQRQAVHARHVDVADDHVDRRRGRRALRAPRRRRGRTGTDLAVPDLPAELLLDEGLQVGLVVDDEDRRRHAFLPGGNSFHDHPANRRS